MIGEFKYKFCTPGYDAEVFKTKVLKSDKKIFSLYSSMDQEEVEKMPSASRKFAFVFLILIIVSALIFKFGFMGLFKPRFAIANNSSEKIISKSSSGLLSGFFKPEQKNTSSPKKILPVVKNVKLESVEQVDPVILESLKTQDTHDNQEVQNKNFYNIVGYLSDLENPYNSFFLYQNENGLEKKIRAFDFDKICKCNSIAGLTVGMTYEF
jgi:hypothetical protein